MAAQGAFAALLNARIGWFDPKYPWKYSGEFQARFFDELLRKGHPYLGEASQRSKEELVGQVEASGAMTYRWCYYGITLLGDPHVAFKTSPAAPRALAGQAPGQARTEPRASGAPPAAKDFSNAFARESSPPANN